MVLLQNFMAYIIDLRLLEIGDNSILL